MKDSPLTIADVSHNEPGLAILIDQINQHGEGQLHLIIGMVKDKEVNKVLQMLPQSSQFYFTQSSVPRSMQALELQTKALEAGISGEAYTDVNEALSAATKNAQTNDLILVCGSTFVVAEIEGL